MDGFWLKSTIDDWKGKIPGIIRSFESQISDSQKALENATSGKVGHGLVASCNADLFRKQISAVTAQKVVWQTTITNRINAFVSIAQQTDTAVAQLVIDSQKAFFNNYSLRPETQSSTNWWDGWNKFWGNVGESLSNTWESVKSFVCSSAGFQVITSALEVVAGVATIVAGIAGIIGTIGIGTPAGIAAIAGGVALIAHGSGGLQEGIQAYSGNENPSNWLRDSVGDTAYNVIGIGGAIVSSFATGGLTGLITLGAGFSVGAGSSYVAHNVIGVREVGSQYIGLFAGIIAAIISGGIAIKISSKAPSVNSEGVGDVGQYTQKIKWGIQDVEVRPAGKGFFGQRTQQINPRVDAYELKINPNNESYYLKSPSGGYVQYENMVNDVVMDGKLVIQQKSFYHINDLPEFAKNKVLQEATRQVEAANNVGYTVEWLVSDPKAVAQLTDFFKNKNININIVVKYFPE